jgi:flagellar export protein FliJ
MKAFRFALDRALHIRRTQLEIERSKLQKLVREGEQLDKQAAALIAEAAGNRRMVSTQQLLTGSEIAMMPDYQRASKQRLLKLDSLKQDLVKRIQEQQRQTVEAERKVKLLEKLRAKRFSEWETLTRKEQEDFASDAFLARWTPS